VVIALGSVWALRLPFIAAVSTLTLAELATGVVAAQGDSERRRRRCLVRATEATFETLGFDARCAHAYGPVYATVAARVRKPRGSRAVDQMIAATALAYDLPLYTRNARDLAGLDELIEIVDLS
jgi:hypothetical protein